MFHLLNADIIITTTLSNHNCKEFQMDLFNKETTGESHGHKELLIIHRKTNQLSTGLLLKRKIQMLLNLQLDITIRWENGLQEPGHILTAPLMMDLMTTKLLILCTKSITFDCYLFNFWFANIFKNFNHLMFRKFNLILK